MTWPVRPTLAKLHSCGHMGLRGLGEAYAPGSAWLVLLPLLPLLPTSTTSCTGCMLAAGSVAGQPPPSPWLPGACDLCRFAGGSWPAPPSPPPPAPGAGCCPCPDPVPGPCSWSGCLPAGPGACGPSGGVGGTLSRDRSAFQPCRSCASTSSSRQASSVWSSPIPGLMTSVLSPGSRGRCTSTVTLWRVIMPTATSSITMSP
mmetsp:Transcript_21441/g.54596  ORF Transcript_21441/g.54596 Transcript_21441/m.54596 type:complete len:202 (+) Transcript_21441:645-1250(+)